LSHNGLTAQTIPPPPIFFDDFSSSEEEAPQHVSSEDDVPLSAKLQKIKTKTKATPRGIRKAVKGVAGVASALHMMMRKTLALRTLMRNGESEVVQV
jgi:hypothetical protein